MGDLRDSGEIEQEADLIFLLYRDEVYHPENPETQGIAEVLLEKNRHGETGPLKTTFSAEQTMFGDYSPHFGGAA
jgi:replicative DNA helicase